MVVVTKLTINVLLCLMGSYIYFALFDFFVFDMIPVCSMINKLQNFKQGYLFSQCLTLTMYLRMVISRLTSINAAI
jgi:hypothetical protein